MSLTLIKDGTIMHIVDMGDNWLGAHWPATATALATSPTIHTVNMSENELSAHGPATATALAASPIKDV